MKNVFLLIGSVCIPSFCFLQNPIQAALDNLAKDPAMRSAGFSACVMDAQTGEVVATYQPDLSVSPASALKIATTSAALDILEPAFTFKTEIQYDGKIEKDGLLYGNLYVKGGGDPTLGSDQMDEAIGLESLLDQWAVAIKDAGITCVIGQVIGDASYFSTQVNPGGWQYSDLGNYYGSGAWGLNLHENIYYILFQQNPRLGQQPSIVAHEPLIPGLELVNEVTSGPAGSGDNAYIYGGPWTQKCFVRGTIPAGSAVFSIKGAVPDPPLFMAQQLRNALAEHEVSNDQPPAGWITNQKNNIRRTLFTHSSPTLSAIVQRANIHSVNLYCEALLKMIGKKLKDEGSTFAGAKALEDYWKNKGLDTKGVFIEDGSGLSPTNAVTSRFLAGVMRLAFQNKKIFDHFNNSLPEAGKTGILKNKFAGTPAYGNLRAKSGTLNRVRTYAGYTRSQSTAKTLAFALLAQNYEGSGTAMRQKLERVMEVMSR